jgi:hypothetical protein
VCGHYGRDHLIWPPPIASPFQRAACRAKDIRVPCSRNFRHVIVDGTTPDGHDVAVAA